MIEKQKIWIVDYGMGNLKSVWGAFNFFGVSVVVSSSFEKADKIVIPGVGAFGQAIYNLKKLKLFEKIKDEILSGKPTLGICLGMQVLFQFSEESEGVEGLSILRGIVKNLRDLSPNLRVPNIGWGRTNLKKSQIFTDLQQEEFFYYIHSYYVLPEDEKIICANFSSENINFTSAISFQNIFGVQFHPEKSGLKGLKVIENFLKL
jgi:glutamine amidotransferase